MRFEFVELVDSLVLPEGAQSPATPTVLIITKAGKYLRGHITDHNVRITSDGRVRGRLVFLYDGNKKDIDANDVSSLEKISS
ncbi:MAG: hypothetical protein SGI74_06505 [Oligoflexia bacterium]|nr:hypothetical protein [Oligoflexia bacterium]